MIRNDLRTLGKQERRDLIAYLAREGIHAEEIGAVVGRCTEQVRVELRRLGLVGCWNARYRRMIGQRGVYSRHAQYPQNNFSSVPSR